MDPADYTYRDLLLLSQLLHTQGLVQPEQVRAADLSAVAREWFQHPASAVSRRQGSFPLAAAPSGDAVLALFEKMLAEAGCGNTTDLANRYYFARVEELEASLAQKKARFQELLA